ncbi:MAG: TRAP transporter small permease [Burkholderiaceae bacterium]|nr:TRAP transporter small permease [Burkholderiaceae bacterium]
MTARAAIVAIDRLAIALAVVAAVLLVLAALVITWSVFWRATGHSTWWEIEFSVYMMVASLFLASPYTLKTQGHVGVDLLSHYLPQRLRFRVAVVVAVIGLLVCAYLAWLGAELAWDSYLKGETTGSTWAPQKWPLYAMLPLGLGLTALQYVVEIIRPAESVADE